VRKKFIIVVSANRVPCSNNSGWGKSPVNEGYLGGGNCLRLPCTNSSFAEADRTWENPQRTKGCSEESAIWGKKKPLRKGSISNTNRVKDQRGSMLLLKSRENAYKEKGWEKEGFKKEGGRWGGPLSSSENLIT